MEYPATISRPTGRRRDHRILGVRSGIIAGLLILMSGGFQLATIREGHAWGGDFALYIHHAKNLVEGQPYGATGYIYNPAVPDLGPRVYPPGYPLLLVPIQWLAGIDLKAMKAELVLLFLLALWFIYLGFRRELSPPSTIAVIGILGFSPYFWGVKDEIGSDIPFLLLVYLAFVLYRRAQVEESARALVWSAALGLCIFAAYATRTVGVVLLAVLFLAPLAEGKGIGKATVVATLVAVGLMIPKTLIVDAGSSYMDQIALDPEVPIRNIYGYLGELSVLWVNGYSKAGRVALFSVFSGLAAIGFFVRFKRTAPMAIFVLLYLPTILLWPAFQGARFLIPLMPAYLFYAFAGFEAITDSLSSRVRRGAFGVLLGAVLLSYVGAYTTSDFGPIEDGVRSDTTLELFDYISENTASEDVIVFRKPRVLSLYTSRNAVVYPMPVEEDADLWEFLDSVKASHLIVGRPFEEDHLYLRRFVERNRANVELVYSNRDFGVYLLGSSSTGSD